MSSSLFADCYLDYGEMAKPAPVKYYIYAEDRKGSYLIPIYESIYKDDVIYKITQIAEGKFHKTWAKKYTHSTYLGPVTDGVYKECKDFNIPFVKLTITRGEYSWYDAVHLIYDVINKKMYFDTKQVNLTYIEDPKGRVDLKLNKEWNGKLIFRQMKTKKSK